VKGEEVGRKREQAGSGVPRSEEHREELVANLSWIVSVVGEVLKEGLLFHVSPEHPRLLLERVGVVPRLARLLLRGLAFSLLPHDVLHNRI